MAVVLGTGQFNLGRDCQIVLIGPYGRVDIPNVTMFNCKQETASVKVKRLDGVILMTEIPDGWTFTIEAERADASLDNLFAAIETSWFTNGMLSVSTLYQFITEANGGTSTFQINNAAIKFDDAGEWKSDSSTKQRISGMGMQRISV